MSCVGFFDRYMSELESFGCRFSAVSPAQSSCHLPPIRPLHGQLYLLQIPVSTHAKNSAGFQCSNYRVTMDTPLLENWLFSCKTMAIYHIPPLLGISKNYWAVKAQFVYVSWCYYRNKTAQELKMIWGVNVKAYLYLSPEISPTSSFHPKDENTYLQCFSVQWYYVQLGLYKVWYR